jgi:hypothetical protein
LLMITNTKTAVALACLAFSGVAGAQSFSSLSISGNLSGSGVGDSIFAAGGSITGTFEGTSATYDSQVRLVISSSTSSLVFVLPNHGTPAGASADLGSFAAGTPLTFQLQVLTTGDTFVSGPAANNPDNVAHAAVVSNFNGTGRTLVAFEDTRGGGDRDFNDYVFSLSNTSNVAAVPEPETYAMMGFGLLAVGWLGRRRPRA